jgi:sulfur relay (sulfurtransferase) complex TusBCD TusD component (DsrE family)
MNIQKASIMNFIIVVHTDPMSASTKSALKFAQTIVKSTRHQLTQIFFLGNGVYCANWLSITSRHVK